MAKLRELRLAAEAQAVGKTKVKRKLAGEGKRGVSRDPSSSPFYLGARGQ
jgi:hypothetical protein